MTSHLVSLPMLSVREEVMRRLKQQVRSQSPCHPVSGSGDLGAVLEKAKVPLIIMCTAHRNGFSDLNFKA